MTKQEALDIREKAIIGEQIETLGGMKIEVVQSDKLGSDWKNYYINNVLVKQEYVEQEIKVGTVENPITWKDGMMPINNAYYIKDEKTAVYMNGEFIEI